MPLRFSVTEEPQFDFRGVPMIPGTDVMQGSVFKDFFDQYPDPTGINQIFSPNMIYDANPGFINSLEDESNNQNDMNLIESFQNFFTDPSKNTQRGLLSLALTGNPITGALSFFAPSIVQGLSNAGGGIMNAFKNFADKRAGRLDITPDSAITIGRPQGAAEGSDAGFENTQTNESFNADANLGTSDYYG
jgi:hypothetical protein|tara:strand:- start:38 stop:607 length:570 start_codon:yes stop_codon:yes gene_type:complete